MKEMTLDEESMEEMIQDDTSLSQVFDVLHDRNISKPKITKLAIIKLKKMNKEQKPSYELIEKGEIILN